MRRVVAQCAVTHFSTTVCQDRRHYPVWRPRRPRGVAPAELPVPPTTPGGPTTEILQRTAPRTSDPFLKKFLKPIVDKFRKEFSSVNIVRFNASFKIRLEENLRPASHRSMSSKNRPASHRSISPQKDRSVARGMILRGDRTSFTDDNHDINSCSLVFPATPTPPGPDPRPVLNQWFSTTTFRPPMQSMSRYVASGASGKISSYPSSPGWKLCTSTTRFRLTIWILAKHSHTYAMLPISCLRRPSVPTQEVTGL